MKKQVAGMVVGMLGILVLAAGCAKPPLEAQKAAVAAQASAVAAQAEVYAAGAMTEAKKLWDDAEAKMKNRAYHEAQMAYQAAKASYELAIGQVEAGKKVMADENQAALKAVEASWAELAKPMQKKAKKLEAALKPAWSTESARIQEIMQKAKDAAASPVDVKKSLEEAKTLIEKWLGIAKK